MGGQKKKSHEKINTHSDAPPCLSSGPFDRPSPSNSSRTPHPRNGVRSGVEGDGGEEEKGGQRVESETTNGTRRTFSAERKAKEHHKRDAGRVGLGHAYAGRIRQSPLCIRSFCLPCSLEPGNDDKPPSPFVQQNHFGARTLLAACVSAILYDPRE